MTGAGAERPTPFVILSRPAPPAVSKDPRPLRHPPRRSSLLALAIITLGLIAPAAHAADPALNPAELRRGFTLVGPKTSDEPALRQERQTHEPSQSFALGAALAAWINAAAALDYDLKTPSGDGGDEEAIAQDCYDERVAFTHLEARREGMAPEPVAKAAGVKDAAVAAGWAVRRGGAPVRCR